MRSDVTLPKQPPRRANRGWVHRLSAKDLEARTAICAHCGPCKIVPVGAKRVWKCRTNLLARKREETRSRSHPRAGRSLQAAKTLKQLVQDIKLRNGCADCGYNASHLALEFDHLPGTVKRASVSSLLGRDFGKDTVLAEIAKCDVVCAPCHRLRTSSRATKPHRT